MNRGSGMDVSPIPQDAMWVFRLAPERILSAWNATGSDEPRPVGRSTGTACGAKAPPQRSVQARLSRPGV